MLRTASTKVLVNGRPGRRICHARGLRQGDAARCRAAVYADYLVIFLAPAQSDLTTMRRILEIFAGASGLLTNFDKCTFTPIGCSQEDMDAALMAFPCRVETFPTKYLGAPLSVNRLPRAAEQSIRW